MYRILILGWLVCTTFCYGNTSLTLVVDESPPYSFLDADGNIEGLSVELVQMLASELSVPLETILCPWARCVQLVEQGTADVIVGLSKTPQREKKMHFITPAFFTGRQEFGFYTLSKDISINQYSDIKPLIIGVLRGSMHYPKFDKDQSLQKIQTTDIKSLINMLLAGHIDTFIHLKTTLPPYLQQYDQKNQIHQASFGHTVVLKGYVVLSKQSAWFKHKGKFTQEMEKLLENNQINSLFEKYGIDTGM